MKIGVIGLGVVGTAVKATFKDAIVYDKYKQIGCINDLRDTEFCFVSVPTPTGYGNQSVRELKNVLDHLNGIKYSGLVLIKCTLVPGTMDLIKKVYPDLKLYHNPEFLTEKNAAEDFKNQPKILYSGPDVDRNVAKIWDMFHKALPAASISWAENYRITELAKYIHNCFLATKVAFMNEMFDYAEEIGANYEIAVGMAAAQGMIGYSHSRVPGPDGKRGFGGMCFPKDTEALMSADKNGHLTILRAAVWSNMKIRGEE